MTRYRKLIVAVVGALAEVSALGVLHGTAAHVVAGIVSFATAAGVYAAPNDPH